MPQGAHPRPPAGSIPLHHLIANLIPLLCLRFVFLWCAACSTHNCKTSTEFQTHKLSGLESTSCPDSPGQASRKSNAGSVARAALQHHKQGSPDGSTEACASTASSKPRHTTLPTDCVKLNNKHSTSHCAYLRALVNFSTSARQGMKLKTDVMRQQHMAAYHTPTAAPHKYEHGRRLARPKPFLVGTNKDHKPGPVLASPQDTARCAKYRAKPMQQRP